MKDQHVQYKNIKVHFSAHLDGGGRDLGQQYLRVVKEKFGSVGHVFEFCSGPGFIGFSLLAHGLCERLTLADINPEAVEACRKTVKDNHLESKVSVYLSDCLDQIPQSEKWDLVVGNPPHWVCADAEQYQKDIRLFDPNLDIHKKFYKDIRRFLKPNGTVLLQENGRATNVEDFRIMIEEGGLRIVDVFKVPHFFLSQGYTLPHLLEYFRRKKISHHGQFSLSPFYFIRCESK